MALGIGLLWNSALQIDEHNKPVILQCRTLQETSPEGHWGPNYLKKQYLCFLIILFLTSGCDDSRWPLNYNGFVSVSKIMGL